MVVNLHLVNRLVGGKNTNMDFAAMVRQRLEAMDTSAITAAEAAGLPRDAIRYVLRGHAPSLDRAAEICEALGMELVILDAAQATNRSSSKTGRSLTSRHSRELMSDLDRALLSEILYGVIVKAADDGLMLRFEEIAAEAARIYAAEMVRANADTDGGENGGRRQT